MKRSILILALLCSACGSFQLGYVRPQQGQSRELMNTDMMYCKGEAEGAARGGAQGFENRLLAATIVGAPAAQSREIDAQREAYRACMVNRGYEYLGTDAKVAQATNPALPKSTQFRMP